MPAQKAFSSPSELLPKSIGMYDVLSVFARRAFSKTYRARHRELSRPVLLKTLHPSVMANSPFGQLLEREAHLLGPLSHDGVLRLLELVRTPDTIALIFEDQGGHTLSSVLSEMRRQNKRIDIPNGVAIAHMVARGLAYLHGRGVVHGDLSPDHVLITPEGSVKLFEFSAAKDGQNRPVPDLLEGEFSLHDYWAPERRLGEALGPGADVFSLGVLLYEMLSFELPFRDVEAPGNANESGGRPRKARSMAAALRTVMPGVPRSLNDVVMRCLARRPEERFEHGQAVADALSGLWADLLPGEEVREKALCARVLYLARLIESEPAPAEGVDAREGREAEAAPALQRQWAQRPLQRFGLLFILIAIGGIFIELVLKRDRENEPPPGGLIEEPGYIRVLARPWAEVYIDGEYMDTTPVGRPIAVAPGRRHLSFRHPNAPEEKRTIVVLKSQTVVVDVSMRIDRIVPDAGTKPKDVDETP